MMFKADFTGSAGVDVTPSGLLKDGCFCAYCRIGCIPLAMINRLEAFWRILMLDAAYR